MKQILLFIAGLVLMTPSLYAGDGSSCEQAIEVTSSIYDLSLEPGDYWFTAWTYDLPMVVTFFPKDQSNPKCPTAEVDFSCDGNYDPDVARALGIGSSAYVQLPIQIKGTQVNVDGKIGYTVNMDAHYRELMFRSGITHDIQAWVKLHVDQAGSGQATPDPVVRNCLNTCYTITKEDTIDIAANDTETAFVFFFRQWEQDSLTMTWTGSSSATLWLAGEDCGFTPNPEQSIKHYDFSAGEAKRFSIDEIEDLIRMADNGGVYYGKVVSNSEGQLRLNITKEAPIPGIRLEHNMSAIIRENEDTVYYFKKNWTATRFNVPTKDSVLVYFGTTPTIDTANADTYLLKFYLDQDQDSTHYMELSNYEIQNLFVSKLGERENYIFMRFVTPNETTITPTPWTPSTHFADNTYQVRLGYNFTIGSTDAVYENIYRMPVKEWENCEITLARTASNNKSFTMALMRDTAITAVKSENALEGSYVLLKATGSDNLKLYHVYDTATVNSWFKEFTQDNEFVYWFFNQNSKKTQLSFSREYLKPQDRPVPTQLRDPLTSSNEDDRVVIFISLTTGECRVFELDEINENTLKQCQSRLTAGLYRVNVGGKRPYLLKVD